MNNPDQPTCPSCGGGMHRDTVCQERVWKCDRYDCRATLPREKTSEEPIECGSEVGITVGILDTICNSLHLLKGRDLSSPEVISAIEDARQAFIGSPLVDSIEEGRTIFDEVFAAVVNLNGSEFNFTDLSALVPGVPDKYLRATLARMQAEGAVKVVREGSVHRPTAYIISRSYSR